jgi:predicted AlkP superfamily pyrophosphatase or phosphodiesterase
MALTVCALAALGSVPDEPETPPPAAVQPQDPPKLLVLVVFDQMRADYQVRWRELFVEGGFKRLQDEGAWYQNCHYPYAYTVTAAGHASMVTGCPPSAHGIVGNEWYDRVAGDITTSVRTKKYRPVPPVIGKDADKVLGAGPQFRLRPSIGDALHKAHKGKGKVVSLSIKDRTAILLAALRTAACYWFSSYTGSFVTSTYYGDSLHKWVDGFNKERVADQWFGKDWQKLRPDLDYVKYSGPDDVASEGIGYAQGRTFPHPMTGGLTKPGKEYYEALTTAPMGNDMLLMLAKRAIVAEKLGQGDATDLLCLSFSCNDYVGHCWGPDSQEMLDVTLRSDLIMKDLLDTLDRQVGRGKYVLAVCSDHGVCPSPEVSRAKGKDAERISPKLLSVKAPAYLDEALGKGQKHPWVESVTGPWVYLNQDLLKELGLESALVEKTLAGWLVKQPGVKAVYTRTQLLADKFQNDAIGQTVRRSFYAERSGDLMVLLEPYYLLIDPLSSPRSKAYTTTHGTPYEYDTHVPLLVFGTGVVPGVRQERVTPLAIAAILTRAAGVDPPEGAEAKLPQGLFK